MHIFDHSVLLGGYSLELFRCVIIQFVFPVSVIYFPHSLKGKTKTDIYLNGRYKTCHLSLTGERNFKLTVEFLEV